MHSSRYSDNEYEYRHVQLPKNMLRVIPKEYQDPSKGTLKLLWEEEWRALGITQVRLVCDTITDVYTNAKIEPWMGTLRSARARAAHTPFQVSAGTPIKVFSKRSADCIKGDLSITFLLVNDRIRGFYLVLSHLDLRFSLGLAYAILRHTAREHAFDDVTSDVFPIHCTLVATNGFFNVPP